MSTNNNISNFLLPGETVIQRYDHLYISSKPITLYWTNLRLIWIYLGPNQMEFIRHNQIKAQYASQPPKCLLKIEYTQPDSGEIANCLLRFKSIESRDNLITYITNAIKKDDKNSAEKSSRPSSKNVQESIDKPDLNSLLLSKNPKLVSPVEIKIRKALLTKNRPLAELHKALVIKGVLTEEEFWENRKNQLDDQMVQLTQPKAQSSGWIDIKAETNEGQGSKYTLTPEIIHSIFLQHPLVQRAYEENVPDKMTEESFWKRYFGSRYFHRNRNASQSGQSIEDELFDKLLEQDDADAQSAANKFDHNKINRLIDLESSFGDRPETGNRPDFTMVAGSDTKALSLIRQFNQHSQQVLRFAKRKRDNEESVSQDKMYEEAILIEDLKIPQPVPEVPLNIKSNSQYTQNSNQPDAEKQKTEQRSRKQISLEFLQNHRQHFAFPLHKYWHSKANKLAGDRLTSIVTKKVTQASRHLNAEKINLPSEILDRVSKEFSVACELLRHFWSCLNATPSDETFKKIERIIASINAGDKSLREWIFKLKETDKSQFHALVKYTTPVFISNAKANKIFRHLSNNRSSYNH